MRDLQIERDDRFVARERVLHRIAVVAMALAVAAGVAGLLGSGPLATTSRDGNGYRVTYDRFARNGAPLQLRVETTDAAGGHVWIEDSLLRATRLERVLPTATAERRSAAGVRFAFEPVAGARAIATFNLTGDGVGLVHGRVGLSPDDAVPVSILLYP